MLLCAACIGHALRRRGGGRGDCPGMGLGVGHPLSDARAPRTHHTSALHVVVEGGGEKSKSDNGGNPTTHGMKSCSVCLPLWASPTVYSFPRLLTRLNFDGIWTKTTFPVSTAWLVHTHTHRVHPSKWP